MADQVRFKPFTGGGGRHFRMVDAPLALVLVQIRWPAHAQFIRGFKDRVLEFGDQLPGYPLYDEITETGITVTAEGITPVSGAAAYRWSTVDGVWTIHLTDRFVSIYCLRHKDYRFPEIQERLTGVAENLASTLQVRMIERVGLRYINRVSDRSVLDDLHNIFHPAVLGYLQLDEPDEVERVSAINQVLYKAEDVNLHVRSGILPAGQTFDPAVASLDRPSWVLDLDAAIERRSQYDPDNVHATITKLAHTAFDFFDSVLLEGGEQKLDGCA